jgi:hypothetical protein
MNAIHELLRAGRGPASRAEIADRITAHLHLHAVLPRLEDLVRLCPEAREELRGLELTLEFVVLGGPSAHLRIREGALSVAPGPYGFPALRLFFLSCGRLNRMFAGEKVIPLPLGGLHQLPRVKRFEKLTAILTRYLKPSEADLADPVFRRRHVELSLLTGLAAACQVGAQDPAVGRVMGALHDGTIQYRVPGGPSAHVRVRQGVLEAAAGEVADPTAVVELRDLEFAVALIQGKIDSFSAVGAGHVRMHGDLMLADEFNALFDRVGLYLH